MALVEFLFVILLLREFPHCTTDSEDWFTWNVKEDTKFGVADSNIEVNSCLVRSLFRLN